MWDVYGMSSSFKDKREGAGVILTLEKCQEVVSSAFLTGQNPSKFLVISYASCLYRSGCWYASSCGYSW